MFQERQTRVDLELAGGIFPIEMFTDGERQFLAAQVRKHQNRFLDLLKLFSGELPPADCGAG